MYWEYAVQCFTCPYSDLKLTHAPAWIICHCNLPLLHTVNGKYKTTAFCALTTHSSTRASNRAAVQFALDVLVRT